MPDFEKCFSDFLESQDSDKGQGALFSLFRSAYTAGWVAAGGEPPKPREDDDGNN